MKKVCFLIKEDIKYAAPAVCELADILAENGYDVDIFNPAGHDTIDHHFWRRATIITYSPLFSGKLGNVEYWLRAIIFSLNYDILISVNSQGFIPGIIGKIINHSLLVSYCMDLVNKHDMSSSLSIRIMEKLISFADCSIDVEVHRQIWRSLNYRINKDMFLMVNSPRKPSRGFKHRFKDNHESVIIIYQGGIGDLQGIEYILEGFALTKTKIGLVLCVYGTESQFENLRLLIQENPKRPLIKLIGPIPHHQLHEITGQADVGICFYPHRIYSDINMTWCAPSKLFDYMAAGLPVICSDNPSLKLWVEEEGWGLCVDPENSRSVAEAMDRLAIDYILRQIFSKKAIDLFLHKYCLEKQAELFLKYLHNVKLGRHND